MDLQAGVQMLATTSFENENAAKLSYKRGQRFELVGYSVGANWCVCRRLDTREEGKVEVANLEPVLEPEELARQVRLMQARVPSLIAALQEKFDETTIGPLLAIGNSHGAAVTMLRKEPMLDSLLKDIVTADPPVSEALRQAMRLLGLLCNESDEHCRRLLEGDQTRMVALLTRHLSMHDSAPLYDKDTRSCATACMKIVNAIARSVHFSAVCTPQVIDTVLSVLGNKLNNIHKEAPNPRAYHLPSYAAFFAALVSHKQGLEALKGDSFQRVITTLHEVKADIDTPVAVDYATGALLMLEPRARDKSRAEAEDGHVMISYNWRHQQLALKVRDRLQEYGYTVWVDVDKMEGNCMMRMAEAVEGAAVVLMFYSAAYSKSRNCMLEAQYVSQLEVDYIPVFTEPECQSIKGILGLMRGTKMYVDLSDDSRFEDGMKALTFQLGSRGKGRTVIRKQLTRVDMGESREPTLLERLQESEKMCEELSKRISKHDEEIRQLRLLITRRRQRACCVVS
eukprot:m.144815 g.144815  ORF g.144815 m.144815 type:complete len:511 (+) comp16774_c4_seq1:228-1760(+)